jgi:F-type H+-transporting ATPase subunit b
MSGTTTTTETPAPAEAPQTGMSGMEGHDTAAEGHTTAEGGHKVFPPLDSSTFPSQILWLAVFFSLLYLLMSKLVLPRIEAILKKRHDHIQGDIATAQRLQKDTQAAIAAYEKELADAKARAHGIAEETRGRLQAETDAERHALEASLAKKVAAAEGKINTARDKAMAQVHDVAADSAIAIVEKLTGAKVSKAAALKASGGKA